MPYIYATKELSINNAKAFVHSMNAEEDSRNVKRSTILYMVVGKSKEWADEPTPINPVDTDQYLRYDIFRNAIGAKKIQSSGCSHITTRYDWTSGTVYSMYRDTDEDVYDRATWVITDEYNVYKCIYNNKGGTSTIKPSGFSTTSFTTSDGYTWKYLYSVSLGEADKFLTPSHMPVKTITTGTGSIESDRQLAVQNAAVNGAIEIVETVAVGSGYNYVANGVVEAGGRSTLKLSAAGSNPPSPIDNFYNGESVYILSGTGAGQLRRVIDYAGATKTLTVNTAFSTTCNTDSRVIISPTITLIGDGKGAKAYSRVDTSTGSISNVSIIALGSGYTKAKVIVSSNAVHGTGATANAVISPVGGHGSDPIRELGGDKLLLNVKFSNLDGVSANGNGYVPSNTSFRTISIMKDPVLKVDANNNHTSIEHVANTSNSPTMLRLTTRMKISYNQMDGSTPKNALAVNDIITNERNRLRAENGTLEFVTELGPAARTSAALANAVKGANANIVYLREDETESDPSFYTVYVNDMDSYSDYAAFTKDDIILKSTSDTKVATVEAIKGPEANTYSGQILVTENVQPVTRSPEQTEDIKIILDF